MRGFLSFLYFYFFIKTITYGYAKRIQRICF